MRAWQWQSAQTLVITNDLTSTLNAWLGCKAYFPKSAGCREGSYLWASQSRLWQWFHTQLVEINLTPLFSLRPPASLFQALLSGCWPPHTLLKKMIRCSVTRPVMRPLLLLVWVSLPLVGWFPSEYKQMPLYPGYGSRGAVIKGWRTMLRLGPFIPLPGFPLSGQSAG